MNTDVSVSKERHEALMNCVEALIVLNDKIEYGKEESAVYALDTQDESVIKYAIQKFDETS